MNARVPFFALCMAASVGCGDDDGEPSLDAGGDGATDNELPAGCDALVEPSDDDTETLQTALIEASSGDVICLAEGTFRPTAELSLAEHRDITLRGVGPDRDDVVIDFADQDLGDDGLVVTADGFTIEHMWVKNTPGNGVVVSADDSVFRDLRVSWDAGAVTDNGAYAVYPTNCRRTIVENVHVEGAADAGIYVGQCTDAIIRGNTARRNVIGIEIENTTRADVYDNDAEDNTLGILAIILPNLMKKDGGEVLIRENRVRDNERENFAEPETTAGSIPSGAGVLVMGMPDVEVRDNEIEDQSGPAVFVASYELFELLSGTSSDDDETDKWVRHIYVHGNSFDNTGTAPEGDWTLIAADTLPAVVWDGVVAPDLEDQADVEVCLGESERDSFLKGASGEVAGLLSEDTLSSDTTDHECEPDPMPELSF